MKLCNRCGEEKDESEFYKHKKTKDGLVYWCKTCQKENGNIYYSKNKEERRAYAKWYRDINYLKHRASRFNCDHKSHIKEEDIKNLLIEQNGNCNICKTDLKDSRFDIDHKIPKAQGGSSELVNLQLLCWMCNRGKYTMSQQDYIEHCRKVVENN